jgi:hypothetical protein
MSYSLAQVRKTIVSLVVLAGAVVALFWTGFDPNLTQAVVVLVGAAFGVLAVFTTKNATPDDWSKAAAQLQAAALSVVGFFVTVPASTETKVGVVIAALLSAYAVFRVPND